MDAARRVPTYHQDNDANWLSKIYHISIKSVSAAFLTLTTTLFLCACREHESARLQWTIPIRHCLFLNLPNFIYIVVEERRQILNIILLQVR